MKESYGEGVATHTGLESCAGARKGMGEALTEACAGRVLSCESFGPGVYHNLALKADGSLVSWGHDADGVVSFTPPGTDFVAVAANGHSVALKSDGSLVAWGSPHSVVSDAPTGNGFVAISAGMYHNVALKADGSLVSWGTGIFGTVSNTPTGHGFTAVSAGSGFCVAIQELDRTIFGYVGRSAGSAVSGVSVSANNGVGSTVTGPTGYYSLTVPHGWSGRVTPSKSGYIFSPSHRDYSNVTSNRFSQDYTAAPLPAIKRVPSQYPTIQAAIDAASDGDTVLVADGTYTGNGNRDINFKGKAIIVRSENGPESCIIDCQGSLSDEHSGFYFYSGENTSSVLEGFSITNGYATDVGGAVVCYMSSPTITHCSIRGNTSSAGGGIACGYSSDAMITDCIISENSSTNGGGIECLQSDPTIMNCDISDNFSTNAGGGIMCNESNPTINHCSISRNYANSGGGIVLGFSSNATITSCVISENESSEGGGIGCWESSPMITNCIISRNETNGGAGGGGILCVDSSNPTIRNCTITGNTVHGIAYGGGIYCERESQPKIYNSILWDNTTHVFSPSDACNENEDICYRNSKPVFKYCDTTYGLDLDIDGGNNFNRDPEFTDAANDDYHLERISPCIDAGLNTVIIAVADDIEGNNRIVRNVDIGAYELQGAWDASEIVSLDPINFTGKLRNAKKSTTSGKFVIKGSSLDVSEAEFLAAESITVSLLNEYDESIVYTATFPRAGGGTYKPGRKGRDGKYTRKRSPKVILDLYNDTFIIADKNVDLTAKRTARWIIVEIEIGDKYLCVGGD